MITNQLLRPASIVVVGASNNVHKPGGAILRNLINGGYTGELRAVNPKETEVQGVTAYADVKDIPDTELAILAIPAQMCPDAVEVLAAEKQVRAFIILSAGFGGRQYILQKHLRFHPRSLRVHWYRSDLLYGDACIRARIQARYLR